MRAGAVAARAGPIDGPGRSSGEASTNPSMEQQAGQGPGAPLLRRPALLPPGGKAPSARAFPPWMEAGMNRAGGVEN